MENKHTKIPCKIQDIKSENGLCKRIKIAYDDTYMNVIKDNGSQDLIARFYSSSGVSQEEQEFNAKLFIAAPKMLETLELLLSELNKLIDHVVDMGFVDFEDESIEGVKDIENAKKLATEAIKKAKI